MAIFSAVSTDSEPELVKNMRSRPGGAIFASRFASSNAIGMTHLKGRREFHGLELLRDRLGDFAPAVTGVHAPQARDAVEHLAAVGGPVVHALGARQQPRIRLELPIGRERHPKCVEIADSSQRRG